MRKKLTQEESNAKRASAWLRRLMQHDILDEEMERQLTARAATGDAEAVQKLVLCNVRLIIRQAAPHARRSGLPIHDVVGETVADLYGSLRKRRLRPSFNFTNFVEWWLKRRLKPLVERMTARARGGRIRSRQLEWLTVVLDSNGEAVTFGEVTPEDEGDEDYEDLADRYERIARVRARLTNVMATVGAIQKAILVRRLMADRPVTHKQLGVEFGLSRKSVRELERSLKKRLQMALSGL
jgi:RNA polymerase sigma factor (sigma-70 family)